MSAAVETTPRQRLVAICILVLLGALAGFLGRGLGGVSFISGDSSAWMPQDTSESRLFDRFSERFGAIDMLLVSWEGCDVGDPILSQVSAEIERRDSAQAELEGRPRYFEAVIDYRSLREALASPGLAPEILDENLRQRTEGFLVGRDGQAGMIVVEGSAYCADNRPDALGLVTDVCDDILGEEKQIRLGGPTFLAVSASDTTRRTLLVVAPMVAGLGLVVLLIMLRHVQMAMVCFVTSGMAALYSVAAIDLAGEGLGDLLVIVPSLAQLLAMSNAIHFYNYYAESYREQGYAGIAWRHAIRSGWLPTVAAALSTIVGFAALASSNLKVASDFAIFGGVAVGISAITVLLAVPAALVVFQPVPKEESRFDKGLVRFLDWITQRQRWQIAITSLLFLGFAGYGLRHLESDVRLETFFKSDSAFLADFRWYEERFAAPQVSELMITYAASEETEQSAFQKFKFIQRLTKAIGEIDEGYVVFSPLVYAGGLASDLTVVQKYFAYKEVLDQAIEAGWIVRDDEGEHWRISVRHPPEPVPHLSKFNQEVAEEIQLAKERADIPIGITLTGAYQLFSNAQDGLLRQLLRSFLLAFLVITPMIIIFLRSFKMGLIAILGNVFPLVLFFGGLGWFFLRIDIAMMTIAAVAFGIAVDDTVHYLTWLGRGYRKQGPDHDPVSYAFRNSAVAIVQTTMVLSVGMMGYFWGEFGPSVRFGMSSAIVLLIAAAGDLLFLPSLIRCLRAGRSRMSPIIPSDD